MAFDRFLCGSALVMSLGLACATPLSAQGWEIETGLDVIDAPQTRIEGLHRLYIGHRFSDTFSFGQGIYSAVLGDAGGAFFWGFEGVAHLPLTDRLGLSFSGFYGGGGGAAQVIGDGTMLRAGASLDYRLSPHWDLQLTAAYLRIQGAPIDGATYGLGFRYRTDAGGAMNGGGMPEFDAISLQATHMRAPSGTRTRPGAPQPAVSLVGVRAMFNLTPNSQLWFSGAGAADGAQGYMQLMGGARYSVPLGRATLFAEGGLGLAGGGNVDTGAGAIVTAAIGAAMPVSRNIDVELSLGGIASVDGPYRAATLSLGVTRHFGRDGGTGDGQRWAYTGGFQLQDAGAGFYLAPAGRDSVVAMQESSFDYFLGRRSYVTGSALTTVGGGVAGYALGMVGFGYEIPLNDRWSVSVEGLLGAAGGGGVNTAGGIVGAARVEVDYRVGANWRLSMGLGQMATLRSGGMQPATLSLGVKIPFVTHR
ncbi:hypothetical protein LCM17_10330 [Cereibacter sphaeroides]|nr:hypothetical protein [Cereibacter sphaeroides]